MHKKDTANNAWSEPSEKYMMGFFAKTVNDLLIPQKTYVIDIWYGSKYRSSRLKVLCKKVVLQILENSQEKICKESLKGEIMA